MKDTLQSLLLFLNPLVSFYMIFVLRIITTFNIYTLIPQYMVKSLSSIDSSETCITPQALTFISFNNQNVIIIPNRWNKIKLCFCFSTRLFIIKQRMIFWKRLTSGIWNDENLWCQLEKTSLFVKNKRYLAIMLAREK